MKRPRVRGGQGLLALIEILDLLHAVPRIWKCGELLHDKEPLERSGMRWTIDGAQSILDLRSVIASDLWESYQAHYRERTLRERYGEHRKNFAYELGLAA